MTHLRIGNRLISKEFISLQMKGREFYSFESLSNEDASRFHLDEVYFDCREVICRPIGLQRVWFTRLCIHEQQLGEWSISFKLQI